MASGLKRNIQALKRMVLEEPDDPPIPLYSAWIVRVVTFFVVIPLAAIAVLISGLAPIVSYFPDSGGVLLEGTRSMIVLRQSIIAVLHIAYLCLVFSDLMLARPIYRIYRQTLVFPALVFLGYLAFGLSVFVGIDMVGYDKLSKSLELASYVFFFLLYFLWALRESFEWKKFFSKRAEKSVWWFVELVAMVVLGLGIKWIISDYQPGKFPPFYGNKDSAILFTLAFWTCMSVVTNLARGEAFHSVYNDYLNGVPPTGEVRLPELPLGEISSILDVGCADGRRLCEILDWLGLAQVRLKVEGFDRDGKQEERFVKRLKAFLPADSEVRFATELADSRDVSLVVFSHFIYSPTNAATAARIIHDCGLGTYVIVRGSAPNSVFQAVSRANSLRLFTPASGHAWTTSTLRDLVQRASLCRVDPTKELVNGMVPDALVKQSYDLNEGIDPIVDFLGYLYGPTVAEESKDYFQSLYKSTGSVSFLLPNDDMVFVFRKCAARRKGRAKRKRRH